MRSFLGVALLAPALGLCAPGAAAQAAVSSSNAQYTSVHFRAPYAERLIVAVKHEHAEIQKIGLHVTLPGHRDHVIIASDLPAKIGKKSSPSDMTVVATGKPSALRQMKGSFWDMALPIADARGADIGGGLLILEIPFRYANTRPEALHQAIAIRNEIQAKIPRAGALFKS